MAKDDFQEELIRIFFAPSVSLKLECNDNQGRVHCYSGIVTSVETNFMELTLEEEVEAFSYIRPGNELILVVGGENELLLHYFRTRVIEKVSSPGTTLKTTLPERTTVSSLRSFFRCDITLPFSYLIESVLEFPGKTKNLSAGGLLGMIKYDSALAVDMTVDIRFHLPDLPKPFTFPAQIVRLETASGNQQLIAVKFNNISEANQNLIIKYLFQYQRELKAKKAL
ncbi:MAG TPA: PilZ domain-containing protein [Bacillota bacterium]|nr:PilZ domain-containing protein [Bacillota bacterium]